MWLVMGRCPWRLAGVARRFLYARAFVVAVVGRDGPLELVFLLLLVLSQSRMIGSERKRKKMFSVCGKLDCDATR